MPLSLSVPIVVAAAFVLADGATRTLKQRQKAGECVKKAKVGDSLFAIDTLKEEFHVSKELMVDLDAPIESAEFIELDYGPNFKVVTEHMSKEQYVLTQCGTDEPSDAEINNIKALETSYTRKFFTIPLQNVRAESTVQLAFLDALDVQDRVTQVSGYAVGSCWQKTIGCGGLAVDSYSNVTVMEEQRSSVDAFFADCPWSWATNSQDCTAINEMPTAIHFSASQDPALLHSLEHIKFMAAFFNKEADAWRIFATKVSTMQALKQMSEIPNTRKPVVAWIDYESWSGKIKLSTLAYQKQLTEYAGGSFIDPEAVKDALGDKMDAGYSVNATRDGAAFFDALQDVDAVIDLQYAWDVMGYDFDSFLTSYGLSDTSPQNFIQNRMVIRVDAQISGSSNLDWLESRLLHPDLAVLGLMRVLNPMSEVAIGEHSELPMKFFRNIAIGEAPVALHEDECTKTLVACQSSEFPSMLPMINDLSKLVPDGIPTDQKKKRGSKRKTGKTQEKTGKTGKAKKKTGKARKSGKSKNGKNGKK